MTRTRHPPARNSAPSRSCICGKQQSRSRYRVPCGGELWRASGRSRAECCFRRRAGCLTAGRRGPPGQLVRRPERASRAPLGVSSAAAPRSAQCALGMPTLIAEETNEPISRSYAELDRRYAFAEPTLRRLDVPVLVACDELGRQVGAGSRQPPSACSTRGSPRTRAAACSAVPGGVGE